MKDSMHESLPLEAGNVKEYARDRFILHQLQSLRKEILIEDIFKGTQFLDIFFFKERSIASCVKRIADWLNA